MSRASQIHPEFHVNEYQRDTTMGRVSHITRAMSRALGDPNVMLRTVSDAMEAAYTSTKLSKPGTRSIKLRKKPVKPWVKREKAAAAASHGTKLRRKLLSLKTFEERNVEFRPEVPPKIGLRLERTMGTPILKLFDHKYMTKLSEKISNLDQDRIVERIEKRKKVEVQRRRQLVIDGKAEPEPGEEDLLFHPVLRCKRVMERVNKVKGADPSAIVGGIPVPFQKKLKKLTLVEPFDNYARNGMLFGEHKNHYLRVQRVISKDSTEPPLEEYQSPLRLPSFLSKLPTGTRQSEKRSVYSMLDVQGKSDEGLHSRSMPEVADEVLQPAPTLDGNVAETTQNEVPAKSQDIASKEFVPLSDGEQATKSDRSSLTDKEEGVDNLLGTSEGREAFGVSERVFHDFSMNELEKLYRRVRSKLVEEVFKENQDLAKSMFEKGSNVIEAYKREQAKTDDFLKSSHRKLFDNPSKN